MKNSIPKHEIGELIIFILSVMFCGIIVNNEIGVTGKVEREHSFEKFNSETRNRRANLLIYFRFIYLPSRFAIKLEWQEKWNDRNLLVRKVKNSEIRKVEESNLLIYFLLPSSVSSLHLGLENPPTLYSSIKISTKTTIYEEKGKRRWISNAVQRKRKHRSCKSVNAAMR